MSRPSGKILWLNLNSSLKTDAHLDYSFILLPKWSCSPGLQPLPYFHPKPWDSSCWSSWLDPTPELAWLSSFFWVVSLKVYSRGWHQEVALKLSWLFTVITVRNIPWIKWCSCIVLIFGVLIMWPELTCCLGGCGEGCVFSLKASSAWLCCIIIW